MILKKAFNSEKIISDIYKGNRLKRYSIFVFGVLLQALAFNIFILPSDMVFGTSGIAIVLNYIYKIPPALLILLMHIILIIASFTYLGIDKTQKTIIGSLLYPLFTFLTADIAKFIDLGSTETAIIAITGAVIYGFGTGLVFKAGYTTGGSDVLKQIVSKYGKKSVGSATIYVEGVIVTIGLFVFGWQSFIYSVISLIIIGNMTDKVIIGISEYKTFQIITEKEQEINDYILNQMHHGVTIIPGIGGYTGDKKKLLLCTIPTKEYFLLKEGITRIDNKAFFIVTDTYEVSKGE